LFLRVLQEDAQVALQHVEGIAHLVVIVPGHLLRRGKLQLLDAEPRPLEVPLAALDFVEMACVLQCFHVQNLPSLRHARKSRSDQNTPNAAKAVSSTTARRGSAPRGCAAASRSARG